jgi:hypothetical protein
LIGIKEIGLQRQYREKQVAIRSHEKSLPNVSPAAAHHYTRGRRLQKVRTELTESPETRGAPSPSRPRRRPVRSR